MRLRDADARLHAPHTGVESRFADPHEERWSLRRNPDVDIGGLKLFRHDSHDGVTGTLNDQPPPDGAGRLTIAASPESVADHGRGWSAGQIFVRRERAAVERFGSEDAEVAGRNAPPRQPLGLVAAGVGDVLRVAGDNTFEGVIHAIPVRQAPRRDQTFRFAFGRAGFQHGYQPLGVRIRKRVQKDGIHHRKDRRVGADSKRQNSHYGRRECLAASE